ncbi:rod shape-determining protein MreD [Sphingomonas montana]|uniref:rod shape-determining protein MreD n=1 Tax=Sphingomonas montana TaxID=1843236 RepID=UPI00101AE47A|nr:rod shape-determining protein MreD [Sphingomonas montana]
MIGRPPAGSAHRGALIDGQAPTVSRFARAVPPVTTLLASLLTGVLPIVADAPALPPFGLLVVLGWRLLRPELWRAWMALPLGLADDLLTGQAPGTAMAGWTIVFLVLDVVDERFLFRDYMLDWAIAAVAICVCIIGALLASGQTIAQLPLFLPQMALSILCFPLVERLCAAIDRWRLRQ